MKNIDNRGLYRKAACWEVLCILSLVVGFLPMSSFAQVGGSEPLIKYAQRQAGRTFDEKWSWSFGDALMLLKENNGIKTGAILPIRISTWSFPITLVRLNSDDSQNVRIEPILSVGLGYVWISGLSTIDAKNESIIIYPSSTIGIAASLGVINKVDGSAGTEGSLTLTGVIGLRSMLISFGYDFLSESPVVGMGFCVNLFTLSKNAYRISGID